MTVFLNDQFSHQDGKVLEHNIRAVVIVGVHDVVDIVSDRVNTGDEIGVDGNS